MLEGPKDPKTGERPVLEKGEVPQIYVATRPTELIVTQGAPDYVPIEGTQLLYVKNTDADVFRYLDNDKLYVLISGRWFEATSLYGPWKFVPGTSLPADFKNIPDTSPKALVKMSVPGTPQAQEAVISASIPHTAWVSATTKDLDPDRRLAEGASRSRDAAVIRDEQRSADHQSRQQDLVRLSERRLVRRHVGELDRGRWPLPCRR